jgi:hypothetical protein
MGFILILAPGPTRSGQDGHLIRRRTFWVAPLMPELVADIRVETKQLSLDCGAATVVVGMMG